MKTGIIETIKKAQSGKKSYLALKIDGDWYSLWSKLEEGIGEGSRVRFDYQRREKNGKEYRNITEVYPVKQKMDQGKAKALEAASRFLATSDVKISQVISVAEEFRYWLTEERRTDEK